VLAGVLTYNAVGAAILVFAGAVLGMVGVLLWPPSCTTSRPRSGGPPACVVGAMPRAGEHADEGGRHASVRNGEHLNGNLIVQGGQDVRGWILTISDEAGKMSATIAADGEGFVVRGACTLS
jgi:hypothetical protein